jgi:pimeloyl-ACP methyl ester carboxylesterase
MTPILYLHGFASGPSSSKAGFFREGLERADFHVTVPDLAEGDFEHLTLTRQLEAMRGAAPSGAVSLIGASMGGYLAALYAARHPEVERLVLLAPAFGFARRWPERLGEAQMRQWRETGSMEVYHYAERRNCRLSYDLMADSMQYEDQPGFRQPTLIFHGAKDDVVPVRYSEEFAAGRENVRLEIVDSGHDLLNVLDYMLPRVTAFLKA